MPPVNLKSVWTIVLSGSVATIVFDFFGQSFTPMLGLPGLAPVPLANAVIESVFGAPIPPAQICCTISPGSSPIRWAGCSLPNRSPGD